MSERRRDERIPSEELTAYERWELPLLDEHGNEVQPTVREDEIEVVPLTAEDLENIRQEAWNAGLEEGRTAGYREGHEAGHKAGYDKGQIEGLAQGLKTGEARAYDDTRAAVEDKMQRFDMILGELLEPIGRHQDEIEAALVNMVVALSRAVIHRELRMDSSHIKRLVHEALDLLPDSAEQIRILVNPADIEWVNQVVAPLDTPAKVQSSVTVQPGGCTVETRFTLIDYTVEKRFQKAVQALLDRQTTPAPGSDVAGMSVRMGELTDFHADLLDEPTEPPAADPSDASAENEHDG